MNVHQGDDVLTVLVLLFGHAVGHLPLMMVVDVAHDGHRFFVFVLLVGEIVFNGFFPNQISNGFRAIFIIWPLPRWASF